MQIKQFRGVEFINRDRECEFFLDYFKKEPQRVLWVYGPKSTGKTTLMEYIIENYLLNDPNYNIKYINFRGKMIANYDNFIDAFIKPEGDTSFFKDLKLTVDLKFIKIDSKLYERIKKREYDFFEAMEDQFLDFSKNRKNILIIDEIQTLQEIYMNGGRLLLNEFLNFCIRLTKELHICHVLILTSNTIFLNQIYTNSKMKETSLFELIDHLSFDDIKEWLLNEGFRLEDIEIIYDHLGGSATRIKKLIDFHKRFDSIKEYLNEEVLIARNEIKIYLEKERFTKEEKERLFFLAKEIIKNGYFDNSKIEGYLELVSKLTEVEILFYDPVKNITTVNSKIYEKAFENIFNEFDRV